MYVNKYLNNKWSVLFLLFVIFSNADSIAQTIENPVFDRSDNPAFHIIKIKIAKDTTYAFCSYSAEAGSWVNISKDTYIETNDGTKYQILKVNGIPFAPDKRTFDTPAQIDVTLFFPSISADKINIIEDANSNAFNIYGINLKERYNTTFSYEYYCHFYEMSHQCDSVGDLGKAIDYKLKQQKAAQYLYGLRSLYCGTIAYDLCLLFNKSPEKKEDFENALYWGELSFSILSELPDYLGVSKDDIARIENSLAACCLNLGYNKKALEYGENSLRIRKELYGTDNDLYANSLLNIANVYKSDNNIQKAIDCLFQASGIYLRTRGKYSSNYYSATFQLMITYLRSYNIEKAHSLTQELLPICDSIYSKNSNQYLILLSNIVQCHYYNNSLEEALKYAEEACNISDVLCENSPDSEMAEVSVGNLMRVYNDTKRFANTISVGKEHISLADSNYRIAISLSEAYENVNDLENAIIFSCKALSLCDKNTDEYLRGIDRLGILYNNQGDYLKAKDVFDNLLSVYDSIIIKDSVLYANVLSHTSVVYSYLERNKEAISFAQKSKQIRYNLLNSTQDDRNTLYENYLLSIVNLATFMINEYDDEAIPTLDEALDFISQNKEWLDYQRLYARIICLKGSYYKNIGLFNEALNLLTHASELQINTDSINYLQTLVEMSGIYEHMGEYESSLQIAMKAKSVAELVLGKSHPYYAIILNQIAGYNYHMGNYHQAIESERTIVDISLKTYGYYSPQYAEALNNIASIYRAIGDRERGRKYKKESLHILDYIGTDYGILYSSLCRDIAMFNSDSTLIYLDKAKRGLIKCGQDKSNTMVKVLQNEAEYFLHINDTIKAIDCLNKAMDIIKDYEGENTIEYAEIYESLSSIYTRTDIEQSLKYAEECLKLYQDIYSKNSFGYAEELLSYAKRLFSYNIKTDSIIRYLRESFDIMTSHFVNSALMMPHKETLTYWNRVLGYEFNEWIPLICNSYNTRHSNQLLYDDLLFLKGLMLSIDNRTRQSILLSKDDSLINLYKDFCRISTNINDQLSLPINKRRNNIDSLFSIKEKIGWSLSHMLKSKGYTTLQSFTWEDIKEQLNGNDLAVEFGNYLDKNNNLIYYALAINNNSSYPKLIRLFEEAELDNILKEESMDSLRLSNIIWKPIFKEFTNVSNIYFSPFGILSLYGIEYLPVSFELNSDSLTFYRLSSTKELCNRRNVKEKRNAVLYGGINYDSKDGYNSDLGEFDFSKDYQELTRSVSLRGDFEPLANSEEEIDAISSFLSSEGIRCEIYKNNKATEKSLKALSSKTISFLHLATHGMYINRADADEKKLNSNLGFIISDEAADNEERALSRSFLVMSGGNMLMHRDSTIYAEDDGILTALEISQLNLKDLDIVVLSACESALGDITPEGVYGLQRGFKKAGANTILMSLEKIDDEATKILMVEFYKNLMNGKTKHQSLKDAQKYLRQVDNGKYNKPEYWASFILLDGLN